MFGHKMRPEWREFFEPVWEKLSEESIALLWRYHCATIQSLEPAELVEFIGLACDQYYAGRPGEITGGAAFPSDDDIQRFLDGVLQLAKNWEENPDGPQIRPVMFVQVGRGAGPHLQPACEGLVERTLKNPSDNTFVDEVTGEGATVSPAEGAEELSMAMPMLQMMNCFQQLNAKHPADIRTFIRIMLARTCGIHCKPGEHPSDEILDSAADDALRSLLVMNDICGIVSGLRFVQLRPDKPGSLQFVNTPGYEKVLAVRQRSRAAGEN